ncbi:hypothetical protein [Streptomyces atratus]|uniref:hypothetical protein n=1 Tax=Streptomyces TaxID=1883 RepID=UPI0021A75149|nr:hypothetical protein [Streptomyces atratus]MCT2542869.1 hypothetical protein [Streptomyces atratus]
MSGSGAGTPPGRRTGETAAWVSAITAVVGLLLAVLGIPLVGGSSVNRTIADHAGAPAASASAPAPAGTGAADGPDTTRSGPSQPAPPPVPEGWRRVAEPGLTVVFAVPDGWTRKERNAIQSNWVSPDGAHDMSVKRDTSYGATAQDASAGQLAWYRDTARSSMADLKVRTHTTRQNGRSALWLEIDYHWAGQGEPRKRVEVFVPGDAGRVYQLLLDTAATPGRLATQRRLFATARAQLMIDRAAQS